ncbi:MAG TPA: 2,3-diphosphoglycerate-dependent phosphoglycerate mutase [Parcubacteria group bacterium]|jgi:2,3-bisphosphoglycerate-dependent phosphoglycerate mutase|nr:2,3-diphosphoglycerate-dependent phosphoglycerate mutase [Parcubacteria group bacterium]
MAKLFLVRHGKSEWNHLGLWTGWTDVNLTEEGLDEARKAGEALKGEKIDTVYVSELKRTHQTFEKIKETCGQLGLTCVIDKSLNERNYGVHTGKNKWQVKEEVGEEQFQNIRRGWDVHIPEGETLKDVYTRVVPYYEKSIKEDLKAGKNVLVVAHGNTLRALIKHLEDLDENQICDVEVGTGEVHCYHVDSDAKFISKEVKTS